MITHNSIASEASREVANLTERKNMHTLVYGVKNLSVCLIQTLTPIIPGLAKTEWATKQSFSFSQMTL